MRYLTHGEALDPFAPFDWLRGEMDRLFDRVAAPGDDWTPAATLHETESAYEARLPVAGADPEKIDVNVEGGVLRVSGERPGVPEDAERRYTTERFTGRFRRELRLPTVIDAEKVEAHYHDGILRITLPKAAEALPRRIPVQA